MKHHLIGRFTFTQVADLCSLLGHVIPGTQRRRCHVRRVSAEEMVPKGHVPFDVGKEMDRFVVRVELINHPVFVGLLNRAAEKYGYSQEGVLHIPCHIIVFERVMMTLRNGRTADASEIQDLISYLGKDYSVSAFGITE